MRTALLLVVIPSAFVAISCAPSATSDSRAIDASAIQALDEQWSATAAKNDLEGTVAFYADDAVLLPPNAPIATDRKSIRESWAGLLGPNTAVSWKVSKLKSRNPVNSDIFTEPTRSPSRTRKADRQSVIQANSSRSGRSRWTGSGSVLSIPTTPICPPLQHPKRRNKRTRD